MMRPIFKRFLHDGSGNFGVMTALLMAPLLGTIGMAVDVGYALEQRTQLYNAADAAAVGALSEQSVGVIAALGNGKDGEMAVAESDAKNLFTAQLPANLQAAVSNVQIAITKTGATMNSKISFSVDVPTTFLRILNKNSIRVTGTATAVYSAGSYMDFYMLLDNTPSMGVGATAADIATMERNTTDSCAFACHDLSNANNYYNLAKKLGVSMRIDTVREATQQLTATATSMMRYTDQYRMAVYTFGASATDAKLSMVADMSSNMTSIKNSAAAIDLMTIPNQNYNGDQQTDFDTALTSMKTIIAKGGSGITKSDPEKVLFFVSDGLGDSNKPSGCTQKTTGTRCQEPIDVSFCQPLKDKGIKIAVLYTTYIPLPKNDWYNTWIKPFQSSIATSMANCASPGLYFEVSPSDGIAKAMTALFQKVVSTPRIDS